MIRQHTTTLFVIFPCIVNLALAQTTGSFIDTRDGQVYKTVNFNNPQLGTNVTWLAQNLNYKVQASYAYDNNENNRKTLGLLYTWEAAKKACPSGWHLPSDNEWSFLVNEYGGTEGRGYSLKSETGWADGPLASGHGTNTSRFNALPGGYRNDDGAYDNLSKFGYWWSSSQAGEGKAWRWLLSYQQKFGRYESNVSYSYSVRCVQD